MSDIEAQIERAIEQLYGDEGLTGNLDDKAASRLLDWGVAIARHVCERTATFSEAEAQAYLDPALYNLRRMMRRINRLAGGSGSSAPEELAARLQNLFDSAAEVPGLVTDPPADLESAMRWISSLPSADALESLLAYFAHEGMSDDEA